MLEALAESIEHEGSQSFGQLARLARTLIERCDGTPAGIGVGATGPTYPAEGVIDNPYTLPPNLQGNVREALESQLGLRVVLENDSDSAALGEYWRGAGRGAQSLVCITVGTGIGVGAVVRGVIHRGAGGEHPEAGHHVVEPAGPLCYCGNHGCVESLASGTALVTHAQAAGAPVESAAHVFASADAGDEMCAAVVEAAGAAIVAAAVNLAAVHAADVVVLAGGALGDAAGLRDRMQASLDAFAFVPRGGSAARLAELPELAGCYGAAYFTLRPETTGATI